MGEGVGHMAGQSNFRVIGATTTRSRGVRGGEVDAMPETERAIRTAVQGAQKMAGVRVDHVIACFSGGRPVSWPLSGEVMLEAGPCTVHERRPGAVVHRRARYRAGPGGAARAAGQLRDRPPDHVARPARADGGAAARGHAPAVGGRACDREPADLHPPLRPGAGRACLGALCRRRERAGGGREGAGRSLPSTWAPDTTGISIFMRKHMVWADTVPFGGAHVTGDVSQGLRIPADTAEMIKTRYGGVHATGMDDREVIALEAGYRRLAPRPPVGDAHRADRDHPAADRGDPGGGPRPARRGGGSATCRASASC